MGNCLQTTDLPQIDRAVNSSSLPSIDRVSSVSHQSRSDFHPKLHVDNVAPLPVISPSNKQLIRITDTPSSNMSNITTTSSSYTLRSTSPNNNNNNNQLAMPPLTLGLPPRKNSTTLSSISNNNSNSNSEMTYSYRTTHNTPQATPQPILFLSSLSSSLNTDSINTLNSENTENNDDIDDDEIEQKYQPKQRKRASTHDGLFKSIFTMKHLRINKKASTVKRRGSYQPDPPTNNKNVKFKNKPRAHTITTNIKLNKKKRKRTQSFHVSFNLKRFNSVKTKSKSKLKSKFKLKKSNSKSDIVCKPTSSKLRYKRGTTINSLDICAMTGDVSGIISILKKYEQTYPPFFMEYANQQQHTLLMKAAVLGHFPLMKYLCGRYLQYKNAIFESVEPSYGRDIASTILTFMGDYINYESLCGKSALIFGVSCKHKCRFNVVKYLLETGASVCQPKYSLHGKSPLIHAVEWKQENLIELLLEYGANINVQDRNHGFTPLMYAAKFNNRDLCDFLVMRGADKHIKNSYGKTAINLAKDDHCWGSLLSLDPTQIPKNVLSLAATSPTKNRWGRYSASYSYF